MLQRDRGNFGPADLLAGQDAAVPRDHLQVRVDQNGNVEPEGFNAPRDLADLPGAVEPRVLGIELEIFDSAIEDTHAVMIGFKCQHG